jgi:initiation factor 1A
MVKNTTGGNKAKGHARKQMDKPASFALRIAETADELYAQVVAPLGNGMCHVLCAEDGVTRLCHIRGKFRGRGKSSNIVKRGSWLLVGRREWETPKDKKMENCDLLEVYTDAEIDKLKVTIKSVNWAAFANDEEKDGDQKGGDIEFTDANMDEYAKLIATSSDDKGSSTAVQDDDIIDVDDI